MLIDSTCRVPLATPSPAFLIVDDIDLAGRTMDGSRCLAIREGCYETGTRRDRTKSPPLQAVQHPRASQLKQLKAQRGCIRLRKMQETSDLRNGRAHLVVCEHLWLRGWPRVTRRLSGYYGCGTDPHSHPAAEIPSVFSPARSFVICSRIICPLSRKAGLYEPGWRCVRYLVSRTTLVLQIV